MLQVPGLPAYTTQRAGGFSVGDLPPIAQKMLLGEVNKSIEAIADALKQDTRRANLGLV